MIDVSSFGDMLCESSLEKGSFKAGLFKVHSRFEHVTNFMLEGDSGSTDSTSLISLVDEVIGPGPFNIVVNHDNEEFFNSLFIDTKGFNLGFNTGNLRYNFEPVNCYDSSIKIDTLSDETMTRFYLNMSYLESSLIEYAHPKSLVFLLDEEREKNFSGAFEKEFIARIKASVNLLFGIEPLLGIKGLKGIGFGLTPSGDDFIAGFFVAKYLDASIHKQDMLDVSAKINSLCQEALGENLLSNSFLKSTGQGHINGKFKKLIHSLISGDRQDIEENAGEFMNHGATSGADLATGLTLSLKELFCEKKRTH